MWDTERDQSRKEEKAIRSREVVQGEKETPQEEKIDNVYLIKPGALGDRKDNKIMSISE